MANKPFEDFPHTTLQRGKACLRCRKRKMRCDGVKPACQQCVRAKKADHCEYDDGMGKTRTQLLRENIVRLEQRIKELEDILFESQAVMLCAPHGHSSLGSSLSFFNSAASPTNFPYSDSSFLADSLPISPRIAWPSLRSTSSPFVVDIFSSDHHSLGQPSPELARLMLNIFSPHCRQFGLDVHMGRILETLNNPSEGQRHPVLMNAMYTWACFLSRPEPISEHERDYLSIALYSLPEGLYTGEKIVDIIQGSCLLALYFLVNGRFLEGGYHATAAAAIAIQFGLHLNAIREPFPAWDYSQPFCTNFSSMDVLEGERILAFWQVYNLDRCWSTTLRRPLIIPDGFDLRYSISCPWPRDLAEYEVGNVRVEQTSETVIAFFRGDVSTSGYSAQALRAKASALFARADQLSASCESCLKPASTLMCQVHLLEVTIVNFISDLMPPDQLDSLITEDKFTLLVVHTLAHAALMHIYRPFAYEDPTFSEKCLRSASACIIVINLVGKQDYHYLDPIVGPCWSYAAETFLIELKAQHVASSVVKADIRSQIITLLFAMTTLGSRLPIVAIAANNLQRRLGEI